MDGSSGGALSVGTLYAHGYSPGEIDILERMGFAFRPSTGSYAGSQRLRFIDFAASPTLELIDVEDRSAYEAFVPPGMVPFSPGISLVVNGPGADALAPYEQAMAAWNPYRIHVPYSGHNPAAPGWNYLNFADEIVREVFVYVTQYEEPRPERPASGGHPNSAEAVTGLVFDLPVSGLDALSTLTGEAVKDDSLRIGDLTIYSRPHLPSGLDRSAKKFPLAAVVIHVRDPEKLPAESSRCVRVRWRGDEARQVKMNPSSWDLLLTT